MDLSGLWPIGLIAGFFVVVMLIGRFVSRYGEKLTQTTAHKLSERMEALFRASFPELQPHFHPARVHEFVNARRSRTPSGSPFTWNKPPGFPAAARAELALEGMRDKVRLLDAAGTLLAEFVFEEHKDGGVVRLGKGKFTVNVKGPEPRVRYWHPEREFKWTPSSWKIRSGVSDSPLASSSDTSSPDSSSTSSSSSPSPVAPTAAATAGIVAAGGTFDGGGASAAWDDAGSPGTSSGSSSDNTADFSSVESGSSSTASSTTY
jgi:hypothetical protein